LNERITLVTELNVFADFKPKLPESYRNPNTFSWPISRPICNAT